MEGISKQRSQHLLKIFFTVSILAHVAMLAVKTTNFSMTKLFEKSDQDKQQKVVKIKLINNSNKVKRQIVQTEQVNNNLLKTKAESFLGKANNRVDRQTRAATTGKFKTAGVGNKNGSVSKSQTKKVQRKKNKLKNIKFSDLAVKSSPIVTNKIKQKQKQIQVAKGLKNGSQQSKGLGQSNDYIEEIPLGDFTKLNTQQFQFYGFYDRIRQRLELFWGTNIQQQAQKMMKSGRSIASDHNHITALEIHLNEKGEIIEVSVNSPSGVRELDNAAIKTFNQAGPFPNPPKGMIKNGRAKIKWSFVVNS